ncbi:MAG: AAA-like domain-containing protein [Candidatus Dependentiae bacterium]|nr:AAA-like domain-containing protein [Candidatus Dependentiae bacterium]
MKFFTTVGPIRTDDNYYVSLSKRLNEQELYQLIEQKKYFVLHAPRQTGKTSTILNFAQQLNNEGTYTALYFNVEGAQALRGNIEKALPVIVQEIKNQATMTLPLHDPIFDVFEFLKKEQVPAGSLLITLLSTWSQRSTKPIILFIDEIDSLVGDTLISVLRQLRSGYVQRPHAFPQSVCLVGVRDVRDYRIWSHEDQQIVLGGSAFNIKAQSLRLSDFNQSQVGDLYRQHTAATGQQFDDDAIAYAFEITQGQPWLVNALAYQACFVMVTDRTQAITKEIIEHAKEALILRRDTHLDVLVDRLQEARVRNIIDAIITGIDTSIDFPSDDIQYALDLGLIARRNNNLVIANPIYQEVLPRELTYSTQLTMPQQQLWYINPDGLLNMHKMLTEFTQFYRENSAIWLDKFAYKEAGPHLLIMAFFQRIINCGGRVHREYALGRSRLDVLIIWKTQRIVVELKIWHSPKKTLTEGLQQTADYMDRSNATQGHLVIFDRQEKEWDDKIYTRVEKVENKTITVWGM